MQLQTTCHAVIGVLLYYRVQNNDYDLAVANSVLALFATLVYGWLFLRYGKLPGPLSEAALVQLPWLGVLYLLYHLVQESWDPLLLPILFLTCINISIWFAMYEAVAYFENQERHAVD